MVSDYDEAGYVISGIGMALWLWTNVEIDRPRIAFAHADFLWDFVQERLSVSEVLDIFREKYGWLYVISVTWRSFSCRQNDIPSSGSEVSHPAMGKGHRQGLV